MSNPSAHKFADRLIAALQLSGKCANKPASQRYINETIDRYNETYNARLKAYADEGVLVRFARFTKVLSAKIGVTYIQTVLAGFAGFLLFTQWEQEQKNAIVDSILTDCCNEIKGQCGQHCDLTDAELREAVVSCKDANPFAGLFGGGGLPPELAALLGGGGR
jgi:hypothetical protein